MLRSIYTEQSERENAKANFWSEICLNSNGLFSLNISVSTSTTLQ